MARRQNRLSYNTASFQGVEQTIAKLKRFGSIGEKRIGIISKTNADEIAQMAKSNVSTYRDSELAGKIASSIKVEKVRNNLTYTVRVGEQPMSAYVEFGTGVFVEVPKGWEKIAWHYYVNGKGFMYPHPYLYPAYYIGRRQYKKDLKDSLNYLVERFNSNSI